MNCLEKDWHLGVDVVVVDCTSNYFGLVGSIVRIVKKETSYRVSVNFGGNVIGFDKDDVQIATL